MPDAALGTANTPRQSALQNLSNQLPVANQKLAQQQKAAQQMQLQSAVAAAPVTGNTTTTAQQTGATAATNTGQNMVQNAQNTVAQEGQIAGQGLAEQQRAGQAEVTSQSMGNTQSQMDQVQQFAQLDQSLKQKLYDDTMQFKQDELGRTVFNENQLADYYRSKAENQQAFQNYAQTAQQATSRNLEMMQKAYQMSSEDLKQKYDIAMQKGDEQTAQAIQQQRNANDIAMQNAKNKAANNAAIWSTGGEIAGAAAGAAFGPAGAMAGAGLGKAIGGGLSNVKL